SCNIPNNVWCLLYNIFIAPRIYKESNNSYFYIPDMPIYNDNDKIFGNRTCTFQDTLLQDIIYDVSRFIRNTSKRSFNYITKHPYNSHCYHQMKIYIEEANSLLLEFDIRCNINPAQNVISIYLDSRLEHEYAVLTGTSTNNFPPIIIPSNTCY